MQRKVCPICDQIMHSSRYCEHCRAWVKPYDREVNFFLNERHSQNETDCTYHAKSSPLTKVPDTTLHVGRQSGIGRTAMQKLDALSPEIKKITSKAADTEQTQKPTLGVVQIIIFIFILLNIILPMIQSIF